MYNSCISYISIFTFKELNRFSATSSINFFKRIGSIDANKVLMSAFGFVSAFATEGTLDGSSSFEFSCNENLK